jgi:hypothetical protein
MEPWLLHRLGAVAFIAVFEIMLLVKIGRGLNRGSVSLTFGNRVAGEDYTYLKAHRDEIPVLYWGIIAFLGGCVVVLAAIGVVVGRYLT